MRFPWKPSILAISRTDPASHYLRAVLALLLNAQSNEKLLRDGYSIQTHSDIELNFKMEIVLQDF